MTIQQSIDITVQHIVRLTQTRQMVWDYDAYGDYVASYNGRTVRVRCGSEALLVVGEKRYDLGTTSIAIICDAIAKQSLSRLNQVDEINRLNDWLAGA